MRYERAQCVLLSSCARTATIVLQPLRNTKNCRVEDHIHYRHVTRPTARFSPTYRLFRTQHERRKGTQCEACGPAWAPSTGLEKARILAQSSLGVAFGFVLGHVLLNLDRLVSFALGSGGVTVGTALDGTAGLVRGHAAAHTRTLRRGAVPKLQVGTLKAVKLLALGP